MNEIFLLVLGLVASIFILFFSLVVNWTVHVSMCKEENCPYGWGNFNKFLEQFNEYDKWCVTSWKNSFFSKDLKDYSKYYIHAGIIKFDGKCMILDPISYLRFRIWSKKKWKEMKNIYCVQW